MLKVARLDDRLVHGQVVNNWVKTEGITEIMVVSQAVVSDEMRKSVIEMAVPEDVSLVFCTAQEAVTIYREESEYEDVMLLFANPQEVLKFLENGGVIKKLNVGGMAYQGGRRKLSTAVFATEIEMQVFREIADKGVYLDVRMLATDTSMDLLTLI